MKPHAPLLRHPPTRPCCPHCSPHSAGPGGLPAGVVTPPGGEGTAASAASAAAAAAAAAVGLLGGSPETGLIAVSSNASLASSAAANGVPGQDAGNKTLYLGNLHPFVTEQTLQDVFAGLGGITELKVGGLGGAGSLYSLAAHGRSCAAAVAGSGPALMPTISWLDSASRLVAVCAFARLKRHKSPAAHAGHQGQGHRCERRLRVCQV